MSAFRDLRGQRFGRLLVIRLARRRSTDTLQRAKFWVLCDCGNQKVVRSTSLITGDTRSCGCLRPENLGVSAIDCAGLTFGRLTVIDRAPGRKGDDGARWRCHCTCGRIVVTLGRRLRRGVTQSCGCLPRELARARALDLTGKTFDRLTVLSRAQRKDGDRVIRWNCRCRCGALHVASTSALREGVTRSCGCLAIEVRRRSGRAHLQDLTGRTFSELTVLDRAPNRGHYSAWRCRCSCGRTATVQSRNLVNGNTKSCGHRRFDSWDRREIP